MGRLLILAAATGAGLTMTGCWAPAGDSGVGWGISYTASKSGPPGATVSFDIDVSRSHGTHTVTASVESAAPELTVALSPTTVNVNGATGSAKVVVSIQSAAGTAPGTYPAVIRLVDGSLNLLRASLNVVVTDNSVTSIAKTSDFTLEVAPDGIGTYGSGFLATNGAPGDLVGLSQVRGVPGTELLNWFRPMAGLSLIIGQSAARTAVVLPLSNVSARTYDIDVFFTKSGQEFAYTSTVNVAAATSVSYSLTSEFPFATLPDPVMGHLLTSPDTTASVKVILDPLLTNKDGTYTFSVDSLPGEFSASVSPSSATVTAGGDPVTFIVRFTRIASGTSEITHQPTLRATHDTHSDMNWQLTFPIMVVRQD